MCAVLVIATKLFMDVLWNLYKFLALRRRRLLTARDLFSNIFCFLRCFRERFYADLCLIAEKCVQKSPHEEEEIKLSD